MGLNDPYPFSDGTAKLVATFMMAFTIPGIVLSVLLLTAFAYAAWHPKSKSHLDRVSFRLMTYAIVTNVIFGIAFIMDVSLHGPSPGCNFVAFLTNITLLFSACLLLCIALNLQLVLVHGVNGNAMEKWYLLGSAIVAAALNVPVYALGEFGWNEVNATCWFSNPDDKIRLRYVIGTQSSWTLIIAVAEVITFFVVFFYLMRYDKNARNLMQRSHATQNGTKTATGTPTSNKTMGYASKYRRIIVRIGMYPVLSCILNISTVGLDLYQTIQGVQTNIQFYLSVVDLCLYGLRVFFYAALAASDPSFLNAIRALRGSSELSESERSSNRQLGTTSVGSQGGQLTVHIELQQVRQTDDGAILPSGNNHKDDFDDTYSDSKIDGKANYSEPDAELGRVQYGASGVAAPGQIHRRGHSHKDSREGERDFKRQI